jgi:hypothetical protein
MTALTRGYEMVEKLIEAMQQELARAVAAGFCQGYASDFEKFDAPRIRAEADKQLNWVWVITPNGTNLSLIGVCAKSNEWASAILNSGYASILVYRIEGFTLKTWDRIAADQMVTKNEHFKISGTGVIKDSKRLASFETKVIGPYENRRHEFHFQTDSSSVGKMELIGLRELAIQEAVRKEHSLFAKVGLITVNGVDWQVLMDDFTVKATPQASTLGQQDLVLA